MQHVYLVEYEVVDAIHLLIENSLEFIPIAISRDVSPPAENTDRFRCRRESKMLASGKFVNGGRSGTGIVKLGMLLPA